jgi:hypothetical protein
VSKVRRSLLKDTVSVETYSGQSAYGPIYAAAVSVSVNVDATRRLVRAPDGREAVSEMTLLVHPDDLAKFTPETRITFGGRASTVLAVGPQTFRGYTVSAEVACS